MSEFQQDTRPLEEVGAAVDKIAMLGQGPDEIATIYIVVASIGSLQMILLDKFDSLDGACLLPPVFVSSACGEMQKKRWRAHLAIRIALSQCGILRWSSYSPRSPRAGG